MGPLVCAAAALYQAAAGAPEARDPPPWQAHPLSKVQLAHPGAAAPLLEAVARLLAGVGANPESAGLPPTRGEGLPNSHEEILRRTAPFLSFALLEPDPAGAHGRSHERYSPCKWYRLGKSDLRARMQACRARLGCQGGKRRGKP